MICQRHLPYKPWMESKTRRLPGIQPVKPGEWLLRDEVFAEQMAYRDSLIHSRRSEVFKASEDSLAAQEELLTLVLSELDSDYDIQNDMVLRPDGVDVPLADDLPIITAARLVQEDLLLLDMTAEPTLNAAVLCFPASWTLEEKFGTGLMGIHDYVDSYTPDMGKRVQRMFEAVRPEQPLWRANSLRYSSPELYQPRRVGEDKPKPSKQGGYMRVERQTLRKLSESGAIVFGIHSYIVPWGALSQVEQAMFLETQIE